MAMNQEPLAGSWTHSFEEDQGDILVYRPTHSFAFPPARGRDSLEFGPGGRMAEQMPGPDDRPRNTGGGWTAQGMNRFQQAGSGRVIEILEQTSEILKIRRL